MDFFGKSFGKSFGIFWIFYWIFFEIFGNFFGGIFFDEFFLRNLFGRIFCGMIFLRRLLWEEFFVYNGIGLFVNILVFVKILSKWRRKKKFRSLEVRAQAHRT